MINRRSLIAAVAALSLLPLAAQAEEAVCGKGTLTEDGLHTQPWFVQESFLDMKEELEAAKKEGKHLVVLVEQKGCPYCKTMHEKYFSQRDICDLVRNNFRVLQIDLRGAREVTDFDGSTMPEKEWAKKYLKLRYTPSLLFFAGDAAEIGKKPPLERPVARVEGPYFFPEFELPFRFVMEERFKSVKWDDLVRSKFSRK